MEAECCWFNTTTNCERGETPSYTVKAQKPEHVQKAIEFATKHNIALSVKATGHDFQGRSTGKDTLAIWLHGMKEVSYFENFKPQGCDMEGHRAMQVLGGNQWADVYKEAEKRNVIVVGGNAQTVGTTGGYVQGGGHGCMGVKYGLAVDNVLEVDIVTADGNLLTANACNNPDLFWAVRGGGGGTFGIATRMVYKAHDAFPNYLHYKADFYVKPTDCITCRNTMLEAFNEFVAYTEEH